jgi:hypothetical protein
MEGVRDVKESVTDTARDAIGNRAIPLAMIGIGAAWLLMERNASSASHSRPWRTATDDEAPRQYQWQLEAKAHWRNTSAGHQYSTADDDFGSGESTAHSYRSAVARSRRAGPSFNGGMDRLERGARTTQDRIGRMVRSNPLLVGAGALMLGVAFGMAVPEKDVENEWLGEARDSVMNRAQQMAHDAAAKVQDTAGSLADAAGRIATGGDA